MRTEELLIRLMTRLRDSRLVWDAMGDLYNLRILAAIAGLFDYAEKEMRPAAGAKLLDVGCGRGYAALQIGAGNPDALITGIDYSIMQVRAARKLQRQKNIPNCIFEQGNAGNLRFDDETFDAAVSIGSIKHWPDAVRGLVEIHRVLKPGGRLLVAETDQGASDAEIRRFMDRFDLWFVPGRLLFWGLRNVIFGRSFTQASLADVVRKAGFQNIECRQAPSCPYVIVQATK